LNVECQNFEKALESGNEEKKDDLWPNILGKQG
jgi:hypothetical protein